MGPCSVSTRPLRAYDPSAKQRRSKEKVYSLFHGVTSITSLGPRPATKWPRYAGEISDDIPDLGVDDHLPRVRV